MATLTIRNLPEAVHRALRVRAAERGHSTEAEVRDILAQTVDAPGRVKLGQALREFGEAIGGVELEVLRDSSPGRPTPFA